MAAWRRRRCPRSPRHRRPVQAPTRATQAASSPGFACLTGQLPAQPSGPASCTLIGWLMPAPSTIGPGCPDNPEGARAGPLHDVTDHDYPSARLGRSHQHDVAVQVVRCSPATPLDHLCAVEQCQAPAVATDDRQLPVVVPHHRASLRALAVQGVRDPVTSSARAICTALVAGIHSSEVGCSGTSLPGAQSLRLTWSSPVLPAAGFLSRPR